MIEGTLAYIGCVLILGYFLYSFLDIPLILLVIGGIVAPATELFSFGIDDNFTVPIISGAAMTVTKLFLLL